MLAAHQILTQLINELEKDVHRAKNNIEQPNCNKNENSDEHNDFNQFWKKYASINNYSKSVHESFIKWGHTDKSNENNKWCVTEKVHGANFAIMYNGNKFGAAKRTETLKFGAKFFPGWMNVIENEKSKMIKAFDIVKKHNIFQNKQIIAITIYGELFGGIYSHNDEKYTKPDEIFKKSNIKFVQKHIFYSPNLHFFAFDIRVIILNDNDNENKNDQQSLEIIKENKDNENENNNGNDDDDDHKNSTVITEMVTDNKETKGKDTAADHNDNNDNTNTQGVPQQHEKYKHIRLAFEESLSIFKECGFLYCEPIMIGTFDECIKFNVESFETQIPNKLGLPIAKDKKTGEKIENIAEGIVVRKLKGYQHCMVKIKSSKYYEITKGYKPGSIEAKKNKAKQLESMKRKKQKSKNKNDNDKNDKNKKSGKGKVGKQDTKDSIQPEAIKNDIDESLLVFIESCVNENRFESVFSKIGHLSLQNYVRIKGMMVGDVMKELKQIKEKEIENFTKIQIGLMKKYTIVCVNEFFQPKVNVLMQNAHF